MMTKRYRLMRIVSGIVIFSLVWCCGCMPSGAHRVKTGDHLEKMNQDAKVAYYSRTLKENPHDPELVFRLETSKHEASILHMRNAEKLMKKKFYREAIKELQLSIAFYPGNSRAIAMVDRAKKMKASLYYAEKGKRLVKSEHYLKARDALKKAVELDGDNQDAVEALARFEKRDKEKLRYQLTLRSNAPISLKFKKTPVINVFEILSKLTGVNFIFDKDVKESKVTLFMTDVEFDLFLDVLLKTNNLKAKIINSKTMLIYPGTPAKSKEYDDLFVKTFYLSHLKAKSAVAILAKILKSRNIIANDSLNAVTVRGKKGEVEAAAKIIEANDRLPSEIVLNVEILEVRRQKEKNLGLSLSDTITLGVSETSAGINNDADFGFAGMASFEDIGDITSKELYLSLPTATLKLLKQDGDTKTLAKPQIRVSNHEKASILIGERIPLRSNRKVTTDGSTTYDYSYQEVGIKLKAEPVINMQDQIRLKLNLEVSALGNNVGTVNDPQYAIKTRTTDTSIIVLDGDSVIIGGLISDEDRTTLRKIPLVGEVPVVGRLFTNTDMERVETDILMTITPVIVRSQDIPQGAAAFWSGSEKELSLTEPAEDRIRREGLHNPLPDQDYIKVVNHDAFLPGDGFFSIHVNSFRDVKEAETRSMNLKKMGYETWVKRADIPDKGIYHRVFVGQFGSYAAADQAMEKMVEKPEFDSDIYIVDHAYVYGE